MEIISGIYMHPSPLNRTCASTYIPNAISFHIFLGVRSSSVMKVANSLDTSSWRWRKRPFGISGEGGDEKRDKEWRWDERGWGLEMRLDEKGGEGRWGEMRWGEIRWEEKGGWIRGEMRRDEGRRDKERRGEGERNFHGDSRNITGVRRVGRRGSLRKKSSQKASPLIF